jgi:hypothetical protein
MAKKASKRASKAAVNDTPTTVEQPTVKSRNQEAADAVALQGQKEVIHNEAKELDAAERRATFSGVRDNNLNPEPEVTEVTVKFRDHEGKQTERTYSKEQHGENFKELAAEFKKANASRIVAA